MRLFSCLKYIDDQKIRSILELMSTIEDPEALPPKVLFEGKAAFYIRLQIDRQSQLDRITGKLADKPRWLHPFLRQDKAALTRIIDVFDKLIQESLSVEERYQQQTAKEMLAQVIEFPMATEIPEALPTTITNPDATIDSGTY